MKPPYRSVNLVILVASLVLVVVVVVKGFNVGLNFYEDTAVSGGGTVGRLVKKDERVPVVATEFGEISAVEIDDGVEKGRRKYHLQFITLEPNSVFLPVLLHADMVFYVQTGSGKVTWTNSDEPSEVNLQRGDIYRLTSGTLFYLHSGLEAERPRLRIIAIFANPEEQQLQGRLIGPYSSINDLVRGFDKRVLQAAFQVSEEVIEELTSATDTPAIVHAESKKKNFWQQELLFINAFIGIQRYSKQVAQNKKKHTKTFNFFKEDPDFKNCNGWSTAVTKENLHALHGSNIGVFMVNLTKGSMMGPHWNPMASEVSVVLEGEGMVRVVCPSALTNRECKNSRFKIEEGDVFSVPRFHPMAQTSFNNGSLAFMGFSTTTKKNHPQFLAGKASVLQTLSKSILRASFNVSNTTIDHLLAAQEEAIILDCTSCAEEQETLLEEEIKKKREEEEERRKEEEEARRRKEEEEQRRREEEETRRREEEEERRKREEEEEEGRRKREEEEARRREKKEEEQRKREEEEARRREEEERRKREEEEARRREKKEEEQRKREEEEARRREEEEEEEQRKREEEEEEEERREREEEEARRREEEEEEEQRKREEEEARRREEEEEKQRREEEEARRREEEKEQRREEEEEEEKQRRREEKEEAEEQRRQEEEERQIEKEEQRRKKEKTRQREEEREREKGEQRRREEKERQREKEEERRQEERGRGEEETEQEIARREEEERREWEKQAEEAARKREAREESNDSKIRAAMRTTKVGSIDAQI